MWRASDEIIAKGTALAADALEAAEADIRFEDGRFVVSGTDRAIGLLEVAALGREKGKPLDTYHCWKREHLTFPNGAHVVEVEIDRDTGRVDAGALHRGRRLRRAGQSDDRRRPGAWRDGAGRRPGAARARDLRSRSPGQMVAGSFMDYALPRADDLPSFDLGFNGTPLHDQSAGREGLRRGGRDRRLPGHRQRHPRCAGAARRHRLRGTGDAGAMSGRRCRRHDEAPRARRQRATASPSSTCCSRTCRPPASCWKWRAARASTPCISPLPCPHLVFQPSDPDSAARASIDDWARETGLANVRPAMALDAAIGGVAGRAGRCGAVQQHDPYRALAAAIGLIAGAGPPPAGRRPALSLRALSPRRTAHGAEQRRLRPRPSAAQSRPGASAISRTVAACAQENGFGAPEIVEMPANNLSLIFRRA